MSSFESQVPEDLQDTMQYWMNIENLGSLESPDGIAKISRACGDGLEITLRIRDGTIMDAKFYTEGCGSMLAAGEVVTGLARGKTIQEAFKVSEEVILEKLGGLPPEESEHCAMLASAALKEAIKDYLLFRRESWKRAYQRGR